MQSPRFLKLMLSFIIAIYYTLAKYTSNTKEINLVHNNQVEKSNRIFCGCLLHFIGRDSLELRNLFDDCRENQ